MTTTALSLTPLAGHLAAEVANPLDAVLADAELQDEIRAALPEHGVLVMRGANPTPAQQIELAEIFGDARPPLGQNPRHPDNDLVCVFDSDEGYRAEKWHTDETFVEHPCTGAVLSMQINPEVGGDTLWTSTAAAYDALSNGMKALLANRRARHEINEANFAFHPVIQTHPVTGRKLVYVNEIFTRGIVNLPPGESSAILPFLLWHVQQPQFTYRHTWDDGDVVIWDNRCTQHIALPDFRGRRVVHRVEFHGEPFAPAA
ncbi:MAG: taurine dioxygenase [Acidimicrobiales bacterium]|nr:MAG: taurine dioxygenase [Acidimicrobiales bacterium]